MKGRLAAVAMAIAFGVAGAHAQGAASPSGGEIRHEGDPGGDSATTPGAGLPLPGGGTTRDLTMPGQGGVADTGLGGSTGGTGNGAVSGKPSRDTGAAGVQGTGMSVTGPPGQGIDGGGASGGVTSGRGTSGPSGGGTPPAAGGAAGR